MGQEDKELLLKDLCARLPYNCRVFYEYIDNLDNKTYGYSLTLNTWCINEFNADKAVVKPYLRPMSSMTEEEKHKLLKFGAVTCLENGEVVDVSCVGFERHADIQDYLNACYLDYRGLIPMNLALEAPEDMYNLK